MANTTPGIWKEKDIKGQYLRLQQIYFKQPTTHFLSLCRFLLFCFLIFVVSELRKHVVRHVPISQTDRECFF